MIASRSRRWPRPRPLPTGPYLWLALWVAAAWLTPAAARGQESPPATPSARPPAGYLVAAGLGMALPTYVLDVVLHEGSHALAALAVGAEVTRFSVLPGRHPESGRFYFGYVQSRGRMSRAQRTFFLLAPKLTNALFLGTYAALVGTGTLPENAYGRMALAVLATGFWVDFSKDLVAFWTPPDVTRALQLNGLRSFTARLPFYALHVALSGAGAYLLVRGYQGVFSPTSVTPASRTAPITFTIWRGPVALP